MLRAMHDDNPHPTIRVIALVIVGLTVVAAVCATLPGSRIYRDSNDCAGQAWGGLFAMHHGERPACVSEYVVASTKAAGELSLAVVLVPLIGGGLLVAASARPIRALAWSVATLVISILFLFLTFELDLDLMSSTRTQVLWPARALAYSLAASYLLLLVIGIVGYRAAREQRPEPPAPLPTAVVR
jgi:hypothetical protein